jgi:hypothetical protein
VEATWRQYWNTVVRQAMWSAVGPDSIGLVRSLIDSIQLYVEPRTNLGPVRQGGDRPLHERGVNRGVCGPHWSALARPNGGARG